MKKIWSYIAIFLAGFGTMAIIALKWFNGDDYSLDIKKIKSKRSTGDIITPIEVEVSKTGRKRGKDKPIRAGKQKRLDRKRNKA